MSLELWDILTGFAKEPQCHETAMEASMLCRQHVMRVILITMTMQSDVLVGLIPTTGLCVWV